MNQKIILCYGDSNTWGYVPCANSTNFRLMRYIRYERWTGLLQKLLGNDYYVIEEGLNGRTTNLDYHVFPERNGKTYLPSCLYSHSPVDLVILALGGNDFKAYFNRSVEDIGQGLIDLIDIIQMSKYGKNLEEAPKILITTVPIPLPIAEEFTDEKGIKVFEGAIKKAKSLVELYKKISEEKNCEFLDVSRVIIPSDIDGLHLDNVAHKNLSEILYKKIEKIL